MDKDLFNTLVVLKKINRDQQHKDEPFYSKLDVFNEFEQGMLLSKIIDSYKYQIDELGHVRGMIDFKFNHRTFKFFTI